MLHDTNNFKAFQLIFITTLLIGCGLPHKNPITPEKHLTTSTKLIDYINALASGDVAKIGGLIENGADVNAAANDGATPLIIASQHGHHETVQLLLAAQANVNAANNGFTPLFIASQNGHYETVQLLLAAQANVNAAANNGFTPLFIASQNGHYETVQLLLAAQANVNAANNGATPLYIASQHGHRRIILLLKEYGATK